MEPGIIHDDDFPRRKRWREALAHVLGKNVGVAVALEAERRLQFPSAQRGDNAGSAGTVAGFFTVEALSAFSPTAHQAVAVVDAAFVDIHQRFCGNAA